MHSTWRKIISGSLLLFMPAAVCAQTGPAVLYGTGAVYLNGAQLSTSSAVTVGDVIQTKDTGATNINGAGSSVAVDSNSIVRYETGGFALDRGSISVATGKAMSVFARDFKITPASSAWTEFYVTRSNGTIGIIARKNAVTVSCGSTSATVREGQQVSREDAADCGAIFKHSGAPVAAKAPILDSERVAIGALAAGGVLAVWALSHSDDPVSPSIP